MRRGFKAWCERTSEDYRKALGLRLDEALDPYALAKYLSVRVERPESLPGLPQTALEQLTVTDAESWSAVTLSQDGIVLVILNSGQAPNRQVSSLCHELAHIILNHRPETAHMSQQGFLFRTTFDSEQEEEADWLAACLLVPSGGLIRAYRRSQSPFLLAQHFGVSQRLITWRIRMTGAQKRLRRAARVYSR